MTVPRDAMDASAPSAPRLYDLFLSGKNGRGPDRDLAARVEAAFGSPEKGHLPAPREMALRNRLWLDRAVSWASRHGVRQFLDLGCGYPPGGRIIDLPARDPDARPEQVRLRSISEAALDGGQARVAYIDKDPVAVCHTAALAADGRSVVAAEGDLADPGSVLGNPLVRRCLDFRRPVCLIFGLVLQLWDAETARRITGAYVAAAAPGSVVAVSIPRNDDDEQARRAAGVYTPARFWNHTPADAESFFTGTQIMAPGVVPARGWNAGWADSMRPDSVAYVLCGVGVKG